MLRNVNTGVLHANNVGLLRLREALQLRAMLAGQVHTQYRKKFIYKVKVLCFLYAELMMLAAQVHTQHTHTHTHTHSAVSRGQPDGFPLSVCTRHFSKQLDSDR